MKISKYIYQVGLVGLLGLLAGPLSAQEGIVKGAINGWSQTAVKSSVQKGASRVLMQQGLQPSSEQLLKSAFYATNEVGLDMGFSGTVFKTLFQGKEEIYGVIAAHAITDKFAELQLGKGFVARVFTEEGPVDIPAKVVQPSSLGMLDLALVKFRPEDEKFLTPLSISQTELTSQDILQSGGFALGRRTLFQDRRLLSISPISFRASISGTKESRTGFCGSFVTNAQNQLVGIYVGSLSLEGGSDVGYATHAKFLNNLVDAYHHNGEGFFPLEINHEHILDLRLDEYISEVEFYDVNDTEIYNLRFRNRFSSREVESLLNEYEPRYMDITVRRTTWGKSSGVPVLTENHTARLDRNCITYRYDLKEKKVIETYKKATLGSMMFGFFGL